MLPNKVLTWFLVFLETCLDDLPSETPVSGQPQREVLLWLVIWCYGNGRLQVDRQHGHTVVAQTCRSSLIQPLLCSLGTQILADPEKR